MLLNTVIIVLREVLEAALLVSIFLAMSKMVKLSLSWFFTSVIFGLLGAYLYAINMNWLSELYDYTGQEIANSSMIILIYFFALLGSVALQFSHNRLRAVWFLRVVLSSTIILAMTREGSEIIIYTQGFLHTQDKYISIIMGGFIGACIGASVGLIVYYALIIGSKNRTLLWGQLILTVVASGLLSQVVPLYEQADLITSGQPLWDTTAFIAEDSILGQMLYAVIGYEATPSLWQVLVYVFGLVTFSLSLFFCYRVSEKNNGI